MLVGYYYLKYYYKIYATSLQCMQCTDFARHLMQPCRQRKSFKSNCTAVMQNFAETMDILQSDNEPTSGHMIPVVDSLENALNEYHNERTVQVQNCRF